VRWKNAEVGRRWIKRSSSGAGAKVPVRNC
jgi:hypothetical protein